MINLSLNDETQQSILPVLEETEELIRIAIKKEDGVEGEAEIQAMPDLGFANNAIRMSGGFYTGLFLKWKSVYPFVPVDTTVNSCGVSIYSIKNELSIEEFKSRIISAKRRVALYNYNWNFERGNHFISLCTFENGQHCLVMHASADEFKTSLAEKSLYPVPGVWYYDTIKTVYHPLVNGRYLRYLTGSVAERFISIANDLEGINHTRMNNIANLILGEDVEDEIVYTPHYGMPTSSTIAIGCSWKINKSVLLTVPGRDIYLIQPTSYSESTSWLTPHGLGVSISQPSIQYDESGFYINGKKIITNDDVIRLNNRSIRKINASDGDFNSHINKILHLCKATIHERIHPIATLCKEGFIVFNSM